MQLESMEFDLTEVKHLVAVLNAARWPDVFSAVDLPEAARAAERKLEAMFNTNQTLAVYGTLAPGKPNHHILAPYGGTWSDGTVEGDLFTGGWGSSLGYPAFKPREGGSIIEVKVLKAPALSAAWPSVDEFEGDGYQRILVPVFNAAGELSTVANLYACFQQDVH
jgi:gamma-glutamylcyclotransferase (GGCT)/AIG2-like uncharacterized protein YtfP